MKAYFEDPPAPPKESPYIDFEKFHKAVKTRVFEGMGIDIAKIDMLPPIDGDPLDKMVFLKPAHFNDVVPPAPNIDCP